MQQYVAHIVRRGRCADPRNQKRAVVTGDARQRRLVQDAGTTRVGVCHPSQQRPQGEQGGGGHSPYYQIARRGLRVFGLGAVAVGELDHAP